MRFSMDLKSYPPVWPRGGAGTLRSTAKIKKTQPSMKIQTLLLTNANTGSSGQTLTGGTVVPGSDAASGVRHDEGERQRAGDQFS